MLKLHHMNLLNEIQETTLMMNLYQQQQLQQQQQQLQQQATDQIGSGGADSNMAMLLQQQGGVGGQSNFDVLGSLNQQQRASLGLGSSNFGSPSQQMQMMQQQMAQGLQGSGGGGGGDEQTGLENRIAQLKQDIASGETGNPADGKEDKSPSKRQAHAGDADESAKRQKTDDKAPKEDDGDAGAQQSV